MSIDVDFVFSMPTKYESPNAFAEHLRSNIGLNLSPQDDRWCWLGYHLGMHVDFTPQHDMEDDQGIPYSTHQSSIGLTGYAGAGKLRHALVPMILNIAMSVCYFDDLNGYIVRDSGTLLAHIGWRETDSTFWDFQREAQLQPFLIAEMYQPR